MTETPENTEAMLEGYHLVAAVLRREAVRLNMGDIALAGRLIVALARRAATEMYDRRREAGLSDAEARDSALEHLADAMTACEFDLLDSGRVPGEGPVMVTPR